MKFRDAVYHHKFQAAGGIIGLVCIWACALAIFIRLGMSPQTSLIVAGMSPLVMAAFPLLLRRPLALPFLLPGLLVFFKQNDALSALIWNAPINDLLGLSVALMLIFNLKRNDLSSTLSEAALIFMSLAGLLVALIVSSVNAVNLDDSAKETITFSKDMIFACLIAFSIRDVGALKAFVRWLIFATSVSAAIMVFDAMRGTTLFPTYEGATWQGTARSGGASTESVPFVATMVLIGTLSASILALRSARGRGLYTCAALLGVAAIVASITRSALATLFVAAVWILWRQRKEPIFPYAVSLAGVVLLVLAMAMPQSMISKFSALTNTSDDRTVLRRLSYQEIGIDLFRSAPLLGIGTGNYPERYASDDYRFVSGRGDEPRPLHNIYLQYATETGVVGLMTFLMLIFSIGATFWRASHAPNIALRVHSEALLLGYFAVCIQLLFLSSKSFLGLWILTGAAIAVARLYAEEKQ